MRVIFFIDFKEGWCIMGMPMHFICCCIALLAASLALASVGVCDFDESVSDQFKLYNTTQDADLQWSYVKDLFIQEKSSAKLERPGQHRNFGALKPWSEILEQIEPSRKLLFLIRHGEAMHNVIQAYVGEEEWTKVTEGCSWKNESNGETFQLFDPPLTENGVAQAEALHTVLKNGKVGIEDLTGDLSYATVVSPLSRTLQTFTAILEPWVSAQDIIVDEYCRERFGHNTCDARSPIYWDDNAQEHSETQTEGKRSSHEIQCKAEKGLTDLFPNVQFRISEGTHLGLVSNKDVWWQDNERESDSHIVNRAKMFLERVFTTINDKIVFIVTHSGFLSSVLEAVGRQPYSATNAELVPILIERAGERSQIHSEAIF